MSTLQEYWDAAPELAERMAPAEEYARAELEALRKDAERYRKLRSADMETRNRLEHYAASALDVVLDALPAVGACLT